MDDHYEVRNTALSDLELIFGFFDESIVYQESKGYPVWRNYDRQAIIKDIAAGNQYKVVMNAQPVIVFSVAYSDKVIWREMDDGNAIYLHRIVVNPEFKGKKLFGVILKWAIAHVRERGLKYVRMDTWASNTNIIAYYKGFGFVFVENYTTPDSSTLPTHNRKLALSLLEYKIS